MTFSRPRSAVLTGLSLALAATCLAAMLATQAHGAPLEPTIGLDELRTRLLAAGPSGLPGHFRTVIRGESIESIPVRVLAVTGGPTDILDPRSSLVYFEASGATIDRIGGIAQGMSGSPVYVNVNGRDLLVGALAYGDWFSLRGAGLATPIDAMSRVESDHRASVLELSTPILAQGGAKDRVIITGDPEAHRADHEAGAIVARPLAAMFISGINPRSPIHTRLKTQVENHGMTLLPQATDLGTGSERFLTTFRGGSSLAVLLTRGDMWFGALGTVTYVNGDRLMGFGHSLLGVGDTDYYLSNAWVDGVWPSAITPYKFGVPGALRGTLLSDRPAGVYGRVGPLPAEAVIRARATRTDTGRTATSAVAMPRSVIDSGRLFGGIASYAAYIAGEKLYDTFPVAGSAITTTTVRLTDGTRDYTIVQTNRFDDAWHIPSYVVSDVERIVSQLQLVNDTGIHRAEVTSIDLESEFSPARSTAHIVGVQIPNGLRRGENLVRVQLLQQGVADTRTVDATLTIPAGTSLNGLITVRGQQAAPPSGDQPPSATPQDRRTTDVVVNTLSGLPAYDVVTVEYTSFGDANDGAPGPRPMEIGPPAPSSVTTIATPWFITGQITKMSSPPTIRVSPRTAAYGASASVAGQVPGVSSGDVEIWALRAGDVTETLIATAPVVFGEEGGAFAAYLPRLTRTTRLRVVTPASGDTVEGRASATIRVRARVGLAASTTTPRAGATVTLRATVAPASVTGTVIFERRIGSTWRRIATRPLAGGVAALRYTVPADGAVLRARVSGVPTNAPGFSRILRLRIR
jgi:hypothetical protein